MSIIAWLIIGGLAGWIAGNIMRGGGFGLLGNIGVGVVGAVVGGGLFSLLGLQAGALSARWSPPSSARWYCCG